MSFPSLGQAFGPSQGHAYGSPFGAPGGPHWQSPAFNGQMPTGVPLDPQAAALAGNDPAAIQLFQRLSAQFGASVNWLPAVQGLGQICNALSPDEQRLVQRYLFSANAAQLNEASALRQDPQALAEVLAEDGDWAAAAMNDGPAPAGGSKIWGSGAFPPEKNGRLDGPSDGGGRAGAQGWPPMPGMADFQRAPGAGRPGHAPTAGEGQAPRTSQPGAPFGGGYGGRQTASAPSPTSSMFSNSSTSSPASSSPSPYFAPRGPGPSGTHFPAPGPVAGQPQGFTQWSSSFNGAAPLMVPGAPSVVVNGVPVINGGPWGGMQAGGPMMFPSAPPVMITQYPCLPAPPLAWDACGGFMPYQPFPGWNPWMGGGYGMPSPYFASDLPDVGMSLGMGVGAGLGAGLGAGIGSLLGSFAFGHHHHHCW